MATMHQTFMVAIVVTAILTLIVADAEAEKHAPTLPSSGNVSTVQAETKVTLFDKIKFQGTSQTYKLAPGQCIGLDSSIKNEASSFKGTCAILFDKAGCTGKQRKIEGHAAIMPFGWNNKIESIGSCVGKVQTENFKNILTLYEHAHYRGASYILQPSPEPGICVNLTSYAAWASSVKATGCLRTWTRVGCKGVHLDISEDKEDLARIGFSDVIMSYERCSNQLPKRNGSSTEVVVYSDIGRRGEQTVYNVNPGQCIDIEGFGVGGFEWPQSVDAECVYLYNDKSCVGKRLKIIGSNLDLNYGLIGGDSIQSCLPGSNPPNTSYVMLVRNDGLKSYVQYTLEPTKCFNLMFQFEKADIRSYDADCAILFARRWCQGPQIEIKGIADMPGSWKRKASSVGSCVGPIPKPPANLTIVTIAEDEEGTFTVDIPRGTCTSMHEGGGNWGRHEADSVSTPGCVYWYSTGSDCNGMRRKVDRGKVLISAFEKGVATWSNPYVASLQTCSEYKSGSSYVAIYENAYLNIGYNNFVGFKLDPKSCIDLWGSRDNWVASIDVDCAIVFEGHWCTEESRKIIGAVEELGNWKHRISSIGSCDGPIPTGRSGNSSLLSLYVKVGFEGVNRLYELKTGECVAFSEYVSEPRSASSDGCVQLYDYDRHCRGSFKKLDGDIEDLMDWTNDKYKFNAYQPKSGRRCQT